MHVCVCRQGRESVWPSKHAKTVQLMWRRSFSVRLVSMSLLPQLFSEVHIRLIWKLVKQLQNLMYDHKRKCKTFLWLVISSITAVANYLLCHHFTGNVKYQLQNSWVLHVALVRRLLQSTSCCLWPLWERQKTTVDFFLLPDWHRLDP